MPNAPIGVWQARLYWDPASHEDRLLIFLRRSDGQLTIVTGFDGQGAPTLTTTEPGVRNEFPGFAIMAGMGEALGEVFSHPPASDREIKRLEDALAVERRRVDALLGQLGDMRRAAP